MVKFILMMVFLLAGPSFEGVAEFDRTVHDFGTVSESDGAVETVFSVKNVGKENIIIYSVVSSCGCTSVEWTRETIRPGDTGTIKAEYRNDEGPYPFDKTLKVYVSGLSKPVTLHLKGIVK